ncbi:hypothetical protein PG913_02555 [Tenacibaculum pacificus]|uniref:hypothetical protein n=1 Tax=Tenacibaculum pacificus TaxID=3018314 RepID=UPI0022F38D55|nr:hypothetical protein [Tenacibaculum pacificus]WBX74129.1 hypothetical protein PG913_02555 [Tenacibaculum pacificus]
MKSKITFKKEIIKAVFIIFLSFFSFVVSAQGVSSQLNNIQVDNLSDKQVVSYRDKIKQQGYTLEQALVMAKSKGMPEIEAQKLKTRILNLGNSSVAKTDGNKILKTQDNIYFGLTGKRSEAQKKKNFLGMTFLIIRVFLLHQT